MKWKYSRWFFSLGFIKTHPFVQSLWQVFTRSYSFILHQYKIADFISTCDNSHIRWNKSALRTQSTSNAKQVSHRQSCDMLARNVCHTTRKFASSMKMVEQSRALYASQTTIHIAVPCVISLHFTAHISYAYLLFIRPNLMMLMHQPTPQPAHQQRQHKTDYSRVTDRWIPFDVIRFVVIFTFQWILFVFFMSSSSTGFCHCSLHVSNYSNSTVCLCAVLRAWILLHSSPYCFDRTRTEQSFETVNCGCVCLSHRRCFSCSATISKKRCKRFSSSGT